MPCYFVHYASFLNVSVFSLFGSAAFLLCVSFWACQVLICHFPKAPLLFPCLPGSAFQGNSPGDTWTLPEAVPVAPSQLCWSGKILWILDVLPGLCWLLGQGGLTLGSVSKLRFKFGHWISLQIRPFNASGLTHELLDERNVYLAFSFCCFWLCSLWSGKRCSAGSFGGAEKSVTRRHVIKICIAFTGRKCWNLLF